LTIQFDERQVHQPYEVGAWKLTIDVVVEKTCFILHSFKEFWCLDLHIVVC
jgi:hypothetical protein